MNCWIGVEHQDNGRVVRVAGELTRQQVPELLASCRAGEQVAEVDLADLVSADPAGIDALRGLRDEGTSLTHVPGYIALKLDRSARSSH